MNSQVIAPSQHGLDIVSAALTRATEMGIPVSVAVVDASGTLVAFGKAVAASPMSTRVAQAKAYSVIFTGKTTAELATMAGNRPQFFDAVKNLGSHTLIPSPGGEPLPGGGAIGVSGAADPADDVRIARHAMGMSGGDQPT